MQKGDITEILKVFEKRITKLEKKVMELESTVDELRTGAGKNLEDKSVKFKTLDTMFDELSIEKSAASAKVVYDKCAMLSIRPAASLDSELTAYTDMEPSISMDFLEEGEVFEPPAIASTLTPTVKRVESPKCDRNKGRHLREKKTQKSSNDNSQPIAMRERSKSEPMMEKVCKHYVKKDAEKIELPECKSEMHYGLLVQYPPEDSAK